MPKVVKVKKTTYNFLIICSDGFIFEELKSKAAIGLLYELGLYKVGDGDTVEAEATHLKPQEIDKVWSLKKEDFDYALVDAPEHGGKLQTIQAVLIAFGFADQDIKHIKWQQIDP